MAPIQPIIALFALALFGVQAVNGATTATPNWTLTLYSGPNCDIKMDEVSHKGCSNKCVTGKQISQSAELLASSALQFELFGYENADCHGKVTKLRTDVCAPGIHKSYEVRATCAVGGE